MTRKRTSVEELAREAGTGLDETLIVLWDAGFGDVMSAGDYLRSGDANRARRALGLATRREFGSPEYWQGILFLDRTGLEHLLSEAGVPNAFDNGRLRKRAIHRLKAEIARRGLRAPHPVEEPTSPPPPYPPFHWRNIGHLADIRHITMPEVQAIHQALVADFAHTADPVDPPGVRSVPLLESAIYRPQTANGDVPKYPTIEMAAAALLHAIVHDHPFHNGNKRTALVAMLVFLDENGLLTTCDENSLFKLLLQLAQHALVSGPRDELPDRETLEVAQWLVNCVRWTEKGDRALSWRRLRQILTKYECAFDHRGGVGNRINIARSVHRQGGFLSRPRDIVLRTQIFYGGEGREVSTNTIHQIRRDLELDEEHGIDSMTFYDHAPTSPSEFIIKYRKTLRRLAVV